MTGGGASKSFSKTKNTSLQSISLLRGSHNRKSSLHVAPEVCILHGFPLTQMCRECKNQFICEVCGVEGDHKYHELLNLRPVVVEIMKNFEENFNSF